MRARMNDVKIGVWPTTTFGVVFRTAVQMAQTENLTIADIEEVRLAFVLILKEFRCGSWLQCMNDNVDQPDECCVGCNELPNSVICNPLNSVRNNPWVLLDFALLVYWQFSGRIRIHSN